MHLKRQFVIPVFVITASWLAAQVNTGTITGTATDSSGAAIPNVKVVVLQTETNFESRAVTNAEGLYRVQSLQPGTYRVTFEAAGFKRLIQSGLELRVGDVLPVNATLEVGQLTDSIQVSAQGTLLETETSATGSLTEGDTLYKMPLYQRYVLNSLNLNPGMTMNGYAYGGSLGGFNVAGQRSTGTAVFEDGVLGNDPQSSHWHRHQAGGELGGRSEGSDRHPARRVWPHARAAWSPWSRRAGTNSLHGMAADLGRTRMMTHRQFFNLYKTSDPQPGAPNGVPAWFMQPDASVSGPVLLPHVYNGRNKTFFFFAYQKLIEKKSAAFTSQTPTPAELAGDFTFGGVGVPIYDPLTTRQLADGTWTRDPIPGNVVPLSRFDPVAAKIIGLNPWVPPNTPGSLTSTRPGEQLHLGVEVPHFL